MRQVFFWIYFLASSLTTYQLFSLTCTTHDWVDDLCSLQVYPGTRCQDAQYFRTYCEKQTEGCPEVGGCFGFTPPGHWYPIVESGVPKWRCRCGCFADQTRFLGLKPWSGKQLISSDLPRFVNSLDSGGERTFSLRSFNAVMFSPQSSFYEIKTENNLKILVSSSHPMALASKAGKLISIKQASLLKTGDLLLSSLGASEKISAIKIITDYPGFAVNFNVRSENPAHHLVEAEGLVTGDIAWQEKINSFSSRVMWRHDLVKYLSQQE